MISYIGSKSSLKMGGWISSYIPKDIKIYTEPFSGMFGVYFNMDLDTFPNLEQVVYNDFNVLNSNIFACAKQYDKFYKVLEKQEFQQKRDDSTLTDPKFRKMFEYYQKNIVDNPPILNISSPDFEIGKQYAYCLSQVFSGSSPLTSKFIDLKGKYHCKFNSFVKKMNGVNHGKKILNHLDIISDIENMDFENCIKKYDSPDTFHYIDAPYYKCEAYYSAHDFGLESHKRLADTLKSIEGKFAMSYYYFDQLEEWFPKDRYRWVEKEFNKIAGASKGKKTSIATELLIMNYDNSDIVI